MFVSRNSRLVALAGFVLIAVTMVACSAKADSAASGPAGDGPASKDSAPAAKASASSAGENAANNYDHFTQLPPSLVGHDAAAELRVRTLADVDKARRALIAYIWPSGLPTDKLPAATTVYSGSGDLPKDLKGLNTANIASVEKLSTEVEFGWHSYAYLITPKKPLADGRMMIVHQGHQGDLIDGIGETIDKLVAKGVYVTAMQLPLIGWNRTDLNFTFPDGSAYKAVSCGWSTSHVKTWPVVGPQMIAFKKGSYLRFHIEPVVTNINYFVVKHPDCKVIGLTGLSGGGWTSTVAPAIDKRINVAIPVAGSAPGYVVTAYGNGKGYDQAVDPEQQDKGMRAIADYIDMYTMASVGEGRREIYVNNQFDPEVAPGVHTPQWGPVVARTAEGINKAAGFKADGFSTFTDTTHKQHKISANVQDNVIVPAMTDGSR